MQPSDPRPLSAAELDAPWVVWSFEHHSWWAANSCGYTTNLLAAGLYSEAAAKEIEEGSTYRDTKREEARPLAAVLEASRNGWHSPMVLDWITSLVALARRGAEDAAEQERQFMRAERNYKGWLHTADAYEALRAAAQAVVDSKMSGPHYLGVSPTAFHALKDLLAARAASLTETTEDTSDD